MLTRKKKELLDREELFLRVAQELLLERGFHGLTMDRIAEATQYSKGTIYQHFSCKEELLMELGRRSREKRLAMIERAATFQGLPRERMMAVGEAVELFARLNPEDVRVWEIINAESITEKVSGTNPARVKAYDVAALNIVMGIVRDAIAHGDLTPIAGMTPPIMTFGLWAITDGGYAAILGGAPLHEVGISDPYSAILMNCHILLDGYGWRPLSTTWDYEVTREKVRQEIFPAESKALYGPPDRATAGEPPG